MTGAYVAIAIVAAIAIVEMALSAKWNQFYFTTGLPIFVSRVERRDSLDSVPLENLQKGSATAAGAPLLFHRFGPDAIGFREQTLGIMHGVIRRQPEGASATVVGLVNWYIVATVIALVATLRRNIIDVAPYLGAALAIMYLIQGVRFWRVARALRG
jgi:hypothetical protein